MNEKIRQFLMQTLKAMIKEHREESYIREYAFSNYEKNRIKDEDLILIDELINDEYYKEPIVEEPIVEEPVEEVEE